MYYARYCTTQLFLIVLLGLGGASSAWAQETGKIKGTVTDAQTGESLPGTNVKVEGTTRGAVAGADGVYNILQIDPGTYNVVASFVGYNKTTVENVEVKAGLTAEINIEMTSEEQELGEVTVQAEQNMIQQDVTSTTETYTREDMEATPGISSSLDIFKVQGDAVQGGPNLPLQTGSGQQIEVREGGLKDVHLRGGRGGEILYLVDGLPITHPLYGGRSVFDIDVSNIESIEVVKGAFSAEYGNAQSGVVKIWTRSGRSEYQGGFKYKTDAGLGALGNSFGRQYVNAYFSGLDPITSKVLPFLGIDALKNDVTFFAAANGDLTNTRNDNYRQREVYSLLDLAELTAKQNNKLNLNGKLTYQPTPRLRAVLNYNGSWRRWSDFSWPWVGRPLPFEASSEERSIANHRAVGGRDSYNIGFTLRQTLTDATYYELRAGYLNADFQKNLEGLAPPDYWFFGPDTLNRHDGEPVPYGKSPINGPTVDRTGFNNPNSYQNIWRQNTSSNLTMSADLTSQVLPNHMLKTGVDFHLKNLNYVDIQGGGTKLSNYGRYVTGKDSVAVDPPPGPYKMFSQNRWDFDARPTTGAVYLKDKYEQSSLIINAGLRMDWFMPGGSVFEDDYVNQWCNATGLTKAVNAENPCTLTKADPENPQYKVDWRRFRYSLSPRFGVSFPVYENTKIFFSYGHFSQLPELHYYFRDPYTGGPFTGNPGLKYRHSIKYEFGFRHQFAENWAFDAKTFNRDISDGIGLTGIVDEENGQGSGSVSVADNKSYARARGLKFALENRNRLRTHTSGKVDYTIQWAKGYSSSAFNDYRRSRDDFPNPIRERRLGWDLRHQFIFRGTLQSPEQNPLKAFGMTLPTNWRFTLVTRFDSGSPYTPGVHNRVERQLLFNTATGPWRMNIDLKFRKRFDVAGGKVGFLAEVSNLLDQRNVIVRCGGTTCGWFNEWTGEPFAFGDVNNPNARIRDFYNAYKLRSPRQFSLGRRIQLGLQYDF